MVLIVLFRIGMIFLLIQLRSNHTIQLAQPTILLILLISGGATIASCYLIMPINDTFYFLRVSCILLPMTVGGNTLAGRVWRINMLMTPVLNVGTAATRRSDSFKQKSLDGMTALEDCHHCFARYILGLNVLPVKAIDAANRIPLTPLLRLLCLMTIPQLILQPFGLVMSSM
jgi:hypothetical protein